MDPREAYLEKLEAGLNQGAAEIEKIRAEAENSEPQQRSFLYEFIEKLRAKHDELRSKTEKVKGAGTEQWEEHKDDVEQAHDELERAIDDARSRLHAPD
ncbi:MAG: hypothetical protein GWN84_14295 [Gammaproteobacteria bacterium]|nr:hypothetical protein [Gammaproteobacteria bacterium]NIR83969.1 hypothetical protein [Gammaproteobacteria bacterium]NIR89113.1 hypothetical protein [Gammaproteobacteria bacterium]NIU04915.1 hypothetical protein [Gammaproteobacteria bacterium]NIV52081.1 hypothetical protein [Gammaproteobacteria bacterium]